MAKKNTLIPIQDDINTLFDSQLNEWKLLSDNYAIYDESPNYFSPTSSGRGAKYSSTIAKHHFRPTLKQ